VQLSAVVAEKLLPFVTLYVKPILVLNDPGREMVFEETR
jgi:hypothetical protein